MLVDERIRIRTNKLPIRIQMRIQEAQNGSEMLMVPTFFSSTQVHNTSEENLLVLVRASDPSVIEEVPGPDFTNSIFNQYAVRICQNDTNFFRLHTGTGTCAEENLSTVRLR